MFNINHVTLSVANLDKTLTFYQKFGFKINKEYHDQDVDIVILSLNNVSIELFHYVNHNDLPEHSKDLTLDLKTVGNKHFALGVKDINHAKLFVEENGLSSTPIEIKFGRLKKNYFFIKDPDGILLEIIEE